jgi:hypothetical protein
MMVVSDQANIAPGQLLAQPGLVIRVPGNPNEAVMPVQFNQVSDTVLRAENVLEVEMREVSGVTAPVLGATDPLGGSGKTATQSNNDLNEANMRLSGPINNYDTEVTVPMLDMLCWNNMQFMSLARVIRQVGPTGMSFRDRFMVRPEDIIGRFIVQPLSGFRLLTKQTQIQQMVNLLDRAPVINQMYGPKAVNMPRLFAYILEMGFDMRNVDDFIQKSQQESVLLSAIEEHELWYHGNVPPRRADDNDYRHWLAHSEELKTDRFSMLDESDPQTAAMARAHIADHMRSLARLFERQEETMMIMQQQSTMQNLAGATAYAGGGMTEDLGGVGGEAPEGAATPDQQPNSPKIRTNETQPPGANADVKSPAMAGAPNAGAM